VNLAARLQSSAQPDAILIDAATHNLVSGHVACKPGETITPRGFARPIQIFEVEDFLSEEHRQRRHRLSRTGERVEVNVIDSSDIRAAITELRRIQEELEAQYGGGGE
jgi:hypothetical protein